MKASLSALAPEVVPAPDSATRAAAWVMLVDGWRV